MNGETKAVPSVDISSYADQTDKLGGANVNPKVTTINNIASGADASVQSQPNLKMPSVSEYL